MSKHDKGEDDVATDRHVAGSRDTGGVDRPEDDDTGATTATSDTEDYVGRIAGDDVGYAGETGAEARAHSDGGEE